MNSLAPANTGYSAVSVDVVSLQDFINLRVLVQYTKIQKQAELGVPHSRYKLSGSNKNCCQTPALIVYYELTLFYPCHKKKKKKKNPHKNLSVLKV